MQKRHKNKRQYFREQSISSEKYVIPYIEEIVLINESIKVLEVGCGTGGNLLPFIKRGCDTVGIDINKRLINCAKEFIKETIPNSNVSLINQDIYKVHYKSLNQFDLIIIRDVIEHIRDQERFFKHIKTMLNPDGRIFLGFPPWSMPFGGHQQICRSKILSKTPFLHLLNNHLYKLILKLFSERLDTINSLFEVKETGISIDRFERIIKESKYIIEKKDLYFINPNYEVKFGLKPRKLFIEIARIPYLRDIVTTSYYCLLKLDFNS
jgi:2-polyprenyl-3-methyl-5-hydroxy-6-metoxy-1,4-benzoquinol methylase